MNNLKFEKIEQDGARQDLSENLVSKFTLQPLSRGFGITLGNSLRRILLSSIPGAALVNVEIDGVPHEFSTIDGVVEDVVGIVLNLKGIVFKVEDQDPDFSCELELDITDKDVVLASDFRLPMGVEVVNKDHVICHLNPRTNLRLRATLKKGVGYVSNVDNKKIDPRIGVIAIDSIYNPVKRATFLVEKLQGDKDKLTLEVETNGAIEAKEAVSIAANMLIQHLEVIKAISDEQQPLSYFEEEVVKEEEKDTNQSLNILDLPVRVYNALARSGIRTIKQLLEMKPSELIKIRSLGTKSYQILVEKLKSEGYLVNRENEYDILPTRVDDVEDFKENGEE